MEKQRPPIYNPEDYANSLKKWIKLSNFQSIYLPNNTNFEEKLHDSNNNNLLATKPNDNCHNQFNGTGFPMLLSDSRYEMSLKQFKTVSDLLTKLRIDLNVAYPSFVQEFVGDPLDGVNLLMELLKMVVLTMNGKSNNENQNSQSYERKNFKMSAMVQRKALIDEFNCLQCLLFCCIRYTEAIRRLASTYSLYTVAVCIMSNMNKSRIVALQLLTMVCETENQNGYSLVSEALSTLRLRFSEPVRFRFLVGILLSTIGSNLDLLYYGLRFINTFVEKSESIQNRLYVQAELEQAGFDHFQIKKILNKCSKSLVLDGILSEISKWIQNRIDVEVVIKENDELRKKVKFLEKKIQKYDEEMVIKEFESRKIIIDRQNADDEGISSSERSTTPEELEKNGRTELTVTIDEVIEQMDNIENRSHKEMAIIPSKLQPLPPPKRVKSLIYLNKYSDLDTSANLDFYENKTLSNESCNNSGLTTSEMFIENYKRNCIENFDKCNSMLDSLPNGTKVKNGVSLRKSASFHYSDKYSSLNRMSTEQSDIKSTIMNKLNNEDNHMVPDITMGHCTNIKINIESPRINMYPDWKYEETKLYKEHLNFLPNLLFQRKHNMFDNFEKPSIDLAAVNDSTGCDGNFYFNKSMSTTANHNRDHAMIQMIRNNFPRSLPQLLDDDNNSNTNRGLYLTKLSDSPSGLY